MRYVIKVWRASPLAMLMTALAVLAEAVSNGLRAYGLGEHLSHFTVPTPWGFSVSLAGAVLVAGAAAISVYQAKFATLLLTGKVAAQRAMAAPFLAVCLLISIASMVSHVLEAQRAKGSGEGTTRGTYDRTDAEYKRLTAELDGLAKVRTVATINAEILDLKIPQSIWRRSRQCQDIDREDTKEACKAALALYVERGKAARKSELEGLVKDAKTQLDKTERPAEMPWLDQAIALIWPWLFGMGIVLVATFGYAVSTMQARPVAPAEPANDVGTPRPARAYTRAEAEADLLWLVQHDRHTPSWAELAARWGWKSKGSVTKLVDAMERQGLLARQRDPADGKRMLLKAAA